MLFRPTLWPSLIGWSLNILAGAALAYHRLVGPDLPLWTVIGYFTRANLLGSLLRTKKEKTVLCHAQKHPAALTKATAP